MTDGNYLDLSIFKKSEYPLTIEKSFNNVVSLWTVHIFISYEVHLNAVLRDINET